MAIFIRISAWAVTLLVSGSAWPDSYVCQLPNRQRVVQTEPCAPGAQIKAMPTRPVASSLPASPAPLRSYNPAAEYRPSADAQRIAELERRVKAAEDAADDNHFENMRIDAEANRQMQQRNSDNIWRR